MRKYYIVFVVIIFFVLSGCGEEERTFKLHTAVENFKGDTTVIAVADGDEIYQYQVDFKLWAQETALEATKAQGYDSRQPKQKTEKEILDDIIRNAVVLHKAKKQGLTADYNEAKKYQEEQFEIIMDANDIQTKLINELISDLGVTYEEYVEYAAYGYQDVLTITNLHNKYMEDNPDKTEEDYEKYVDSLVEKAEIEYK